MTEEWEFSQHYENTRYHKPENKSRSWKEALTNGIKVSGVCPCERKDDEGRICWDTVTDGAHIQVKKKCGEAVYPAIVMTCNPCNLRTNKVVVPTKIMLLRKDKDKDKDKDNCFFGKLPVFWAAKGLPYLVNGWIKQSGRWTNIINQTGHWNEITKCEHSAGKTSLEGYMYISKSRDRVEVRAIYNDSSGFFRDLFRGATPKNPIIYEKDCKEIDTHVLYKYDENKRMAAIGARAEQIWKLTEELRDLKLLQEKEVEWEEHVIVQNIFQDEYKRNKEKNELSSVWLGVDESD